MVFKAEKIVIGVLLLVLVIMLSKAWAERPDLDVWQPLFDKEGRFWVYKDGTTLEPPISPYGIPYSPYGWMPANANEMLTLNMGHTENPHGGEGMCIAVTVTWRSPWWCAVGFISGPDSTMRERGGPWWGATPDGWYYNLSGLEKRHFVFHLRGERGDERVQWKVGFLSHEEYGDSLESPAQTVWLLLNREWTRYEIDLSEQDLSHVCSFCFVVSQAYQPEPEAHVSFYIDDIYFE